MNPDANPAVRLAPEELRTLFLFEKLSEEQLGMLSAAGEVVDVAPGPLYAEGEKATCFYVLLSGAIALSHRGGGTDDLEVGRTRQRGVYCGAWEAYLGDDAPEGYGSSVRVLEPARFFVLPAWKFGKVVREWFPMAVHLLEGLRIGITEAQELIGARERLLALGSLTAGLTHELGNPAAALARTLGQLQEGLDVLAPPVPVTGAVAVPRDPLARAEAEDRLLDVLDELGVAEPDDLAPVLVEHGVSAEFLGSLGGRTAVETYARGLSVRSLVAEAASASARISALLASAGNYAQLDRAAEGWVDVRELLDAAIEMLGAGAGRAVGNAHVVKDYADVPKLLGQAGELGQVWTNLLDNALDALAPGPGTVTVRVRDGDPGVVVEIADDGPGIPPELLGRIFEPFVTTKDVGQGTGLGLDIAWRIVVHRHHGRLGVTSEPGNTVFRVWLPLTPEPPTSEATAPEGEQ
ncbi:sensor histidine kinase [Kineococcus sp. GCM10028916]|uniref:sensor histidine kinase n=1 Tax=Kineococcus sp. GCM10028916 TaxID=3273394 RepID=UPI00363853F8